MATVPAIRFLPNAITVMALCSGLTSVVLAMQPSIPGYRTFAIGAIALAAILDSLDGPAARLLHSTSRIGAELDSLSDSISFGVAPALILYIWVMQGHTLGWAACLIYAVCTVLRLARFNSLLDDTPKPWAKGFFTGIPSPAGALLVMVPMLLHLRFPSVAAFDNAWVVGLWAVIIGLMMVSRVPTIALKSVRVAPGLIVPLLIVLVAAVAALVYEPHLMLVIGLAVYLFHLPYAAWKFQYLRRHPELWEEGYRSRVRPAGRRRVRLSVRMPRRQRVAGRGPDGSPLPAERRRGMTGVAGRGRVGGRRRLR